MFTGARLFGAIEERGRNQNSGQGQPDGLVMRDLFLPQSSVQCLEFVVLSRRQWTSIGAAREAEDGVQVRRLGFFQLPTKRFCSSFDRLTH